MEMVNNVLDCVWNYSFLEYIWNELVYEPDDDYSRVSFGCFHEHIDIINKDYGNICSRILKFINETGKDPYGRQANGESLLNFALMNNVWNKDVDTIYRMFVDTKVNSVLPTNENQNDISEFTFI
jgi:hypothetical protein